MYLTQLMKRDSTMKSKDKQRLQTHPQASKEPYLTLEGVVHQGAVVVENGTSIPDGTRVRVVVSASAVPDTTFQALLRVAKTQPPARKVAPTGLGKRRLLLGLILFLTAGSVWALL